MGKTNWSRVFLGGLLAGVVMVILAFATMAIYLSKLWYSALEALGRPIQDTVGFLTFGVIFNLVLGILAVWLYSAIRPRYGAGPKTALIAGLAVWVLSGLSFAAIAASLGLLPANLLVIDELSDLVIKVVATLLGAWVYKEQSR
jgi:magnesium-transporting ATPase (P-type)